MNKIYSKLKDEGIKSINIKSIDEDDFLEMFGDNLTIYSVGDYLDEEEEYRMDECALLVQSNEGDLVIVDDTGAGSDYLIEVFDEYNYIEEE